MHTGKKSKQKIPVSMKRYLSIFSVCVSVRVCVYVCRSVYVRYVCMYEYVHVYKDVDNEQAQSSV